MPTQHPPQPSAPSHLPGRPTHRRTVRYLAGTPQPEDRLGATRSSICSWRGDGRPGVLILRTSGSTP